MSGPSQVIEAALYTTLAAGTALVAHLGGTAIYEGVAPTTASLPVVVFNWQGGGDENQAKGGRLRNPVFTVKAIAGNKALAGTLDGDIDALLHHVTLTVTGYTNIWTAREGDVNYDEVDTGGSVLYHRGGMYRVRVSQ